LKHSCLNYAKNDEKQKPRFLLFVVEKGQDGLFQHSAMHCEIAKYSRKYKAI